MHALKDSQQRMARKLSNNGVCVCDSANPRWRFLHLVFLLIINMTASFPSQIAVPNESAKRRIATGRRWACAARTAAQFFELQSAGTVL
jgi:hypothetical protein